MSSQNMCEDGVLPAGKIGKKGRGPGGVGALGPGYSVHYVNMLITQFEACLMYCSAA